MTGEIRLTQRDPEPFSPRLEGLRLAVELYARREDVTGSMVLHAADIFSDWLAVCPPHPPASEILAALGTIDLRLEKIIMTQEQIDTDVQALGGALATIQAAEVANTGAVEAVAAEIAALQAANPTLDLSGLDALVNGSADGSAPGLVAAAESVTAGVASVQGLVPAAPVTPPVTPNAGVSN
jgi:hypothetical protein